MYIRYIIWKLVGTYILKIERICAFRLLWYLYKTIQLGPVRFFFGFHITDAVVFKFIAFLPFLFFFFVEKKSGRPPFYLLRVALSSTQRILTTGSSSYICSATCMVSGLLTFPEGLRGGGTAFGGHG